MSVTVSQAPIAAFPDATSADAGLQVHCDPGTAGQYLTLPMPAAPATHLRLMWHPAAMTGDGGAVVFAGGFDAAGRPCWSLRHDVNAHRLRLEANGTATLTADLPAAAMWHSIEVRHDPNAATLTWWIDGLPLGAATLPPDATACTHGWVGGLHKASATTGEFRLDDVVTADAYVGPVFRSPAGDHAGDPARWLVIYNAADPDSVAWARTYRETRDVPHMNLLGLHLSTDETIDFDTYLTQILEPVEAFFSRHLAMPEVMGLLLGYRVPGYVVHPTLNRRVAVSALLQTLATHPDVVGNPLATLEPGDRPQAGAMQGVRFTARIDAPTFDAATRLTTRALAAAATPLASTDRVFIQPATTAGGEPYPVRLTAWAAGAEAQQLRTAVEVDLDAAASPADADTAVVWGFGPPQVPDGYFGVSRDALDATQVQASDRRVFAGQWHAAGLGEVSLRRALPGSWVERALAAGYAAAAAGTSEFSESDLPHASPFFAALRRGWTLAEAWGVCKALLRSGLELVGDPLLTVAFPRAGWDVIGPMTGATPVPPEVPTARLPARIHQFQLGATLRHAAGESAWYAVRRVDATGRSEAGFTPLRITHNAGVAVAALPRPVWPDHDDWSPRLVDGRLSTQLHLPAGCDPAASVAIEWHDDRGGPPREVPWDRHDLIVPLDAAVPATPTRFRWRLRGVGGSIVDTPWSRPVASPPLRADALPLLEVC